METYWVVGLLLGPVWLISRRSSTLGPSFPPSVSDAEAVEPAFFGCSFVRHRDSVSGKHGQNPPTYPVCVPLQKWQRRFFILYEHGLLRYALDEMVSVLLGPHRLCLRQATSVWLHLQHLCAITWASVSQPGIFEELVATGRDP